MVVLGAVLGLGMLIGVGASTATGMVTNSALQAKVAQQQAELAQAQRASQAQVNALAARLGELQAQATRLNALGERLTEMGKLKDGEFDFDEPVGVGGGDEPVSDMPVQDFKETLGQVEQQFSASGQQLNVLASLMFDHQLEQNSVPSRMPIRNTYITSGFGGRADPFDGGSAFHKGVDFHANVGDPVLSVADGVVSYAGVRGGYGNVVEVDHGNGVCDPLRAQLAPGGEGGRSGARRPAGRACRFQRPLHRCTRAFRGVGGRARGQSAQIPG
ncbi:hypothetical protein KOJCDNHJ_01779 [Xanthomonas citri pv. punicae]|nr:hypothetical protein FICKIIDM_02951 [Xanthomonas citri pv. punicae]UIS28384.1 hypothetical protein KOJCDNHJ_01779 [Xanthomonas citri pv. punicae]CCF67847.1 peptidase M23 family protein [Xanthomonas citri pv. punicae str. LMG 859]